MVAYTNNNNAINIWCIDNIITVFKCFTFHICTNLKGFDYKDDDAEGLISYKIDSFSLDTEYSIRIRTECSNPYGALFFNQGLIDCEPFLKGFAEGGTRTRDFHVSQSEHPKGILPKQNPFLLGIWEILQGFLRNEKPFGFPI